jgi:hypothetical protein
MNFFEIDYKQRAFDGKWEKLARVMDHENKYIYKSESGAQMTYIPTKWITVGIYDYMGELE